MEKYNPAVWLLPQGVGEIENNNLVNKNKNEK